MGYLDWTFEIKEYFIDFLENFILEAKKENRIENSNFKSFMTLDIESEALKRLEKVHPGLKDFCMEKIGSGYLEWHKDKYSGVGGNIKFIDMKSLFEEDLSDVYDTEMIEENEDIQFFRPWDYGTPEAQCGFVIKPEEIYPSVYYNQTGRSSLHSLDLDYEGYTQMALEARVFYHWQVVLLHHAGWNFGEEETIHFKKHMPEIFPDWTWEKFIARYEELRLSNKK